MYEQIGDFDAFVCTAGEAHFGPFGTATEEELALGVHSKLLGQISLVLLGRSRIFTAAHSPSFRLPLRRPHPRGRELRRRERRRRRLRAVALTLDREVRINAVSPGVAQASSEQFGQFNPGRTPVPSAELRQPSHAVWRDGEPAKSSRAW